MNSLKYFIEAKYYRFFGIRVKLNMLPERVSRCQTRSNPNEVSEILWRRTEWALRDAGYAVKDGAENLVKVWATFPAWEVMRGLHGCGVEDPDAQ